jgi:hypothetical protein
MRHHLHQFLPCLAFLGHSLGRFPVLQIPRRLSRQINFLFYMFMEMSFTLLKCQPYARSKEDRHHAVSRQGKAA